MTDRINRAHVVMLAETGIVEASVARAILEALDAYDRETDTESLRYDGSVEDYYFHVEQDLIKRVGVDLAGQMHTGRSRNDMGHAMFRLVLKTRLEHLTAGLHDAVGALLAKAEAEKRTIFLAYTHGQPAQPTTFGHYLAAFIEVLLRHGERLWLAHRHLDRSPMGAAAITTTGFPIDRERMAELLGFAGVQENSYGCIAATDDVAAIYAALKLLCVDLSRFAQDLGQWTAFETGFLKAPRSYVQISSIMPQKRNPVVTEHLRLLSNLAAGQCDAIVDTMRNTPFMDINDSESETHTAGYQAIDRGQRGLRLLADFISVIEVDEVRIRAAIGDSFATITELADGLVLSDDLSFREAHEIASDLAKDSIAARRSLDEVSFDRFVEIFETRVGRSPAIDHGMLRRIVSPEHFIAVRDRTGGPADVSLNASLEHYRSYLQSQRNDLARAVARRDDAAAKLDQSVRLLLQDQAA
ncbi:MAG: argininosuccinate lyase [Alphaproteobacteria bacterium]|nr:argininosuccinate lyase [Alphaproteobacteria bacterium]